MRVAFCGSRNHINFGFTFLTLVVAVNDEWP
jgi:hypothetical protein